MKFKKGDLVDLWKDINDITELNIPANIKFNYAMIKNRKILEPEIKTLEEISKPEDEFVEFDTQRTNICVDYCEKDQNGVPIIENGVFKIIEEKRPEFNAKLLALRDKYLDAILKREEQVRDFELNLLNEPVDLQLYKINSSVVPKNLKFEQLIPLVYIINDLPEKEKKKIRINEMLQLWTALSSIKESTFENNLVEFAIPAAVNYNILREKVFEIEKSHLPKPEYVEYERKLLDVRRKYADCDENGNPIMVDGNFVIIEKEQQFLEELRELNNEYYQAIEDRNQQLGHMQAILDDEIEIELVLIDIKDFPDTLTVRNLEWLFPMVKDIDE